MDAVAARKLLTELVRSEQLELRRVEIVAKDLVAFMTELDRPPSGRELEEWLGDHAQVEELYANENVLEDLCQRHLAPPPSNIEAPEVRHAELEQAIRDTPDAVESYQVYADWLQEQGDPFGELIAHGIAGPEERAEKFRTAHATRLFGGLSKDLVRRVELGWNHGLVRSIEESVEYGMLGPFEWARLLQLRICGFVQSIKLLQACGPELDEVLAEHAAPTLHELEIYAGSGRVPERLFERPLRSLTLSGNNVTLGEQRFPATLERLELRVSVLAIPNVLELAIRELRTQLTPSIAQHLAAASLPKLERLIIVKPPEQPVAKLGFPTVKHLELRDGRLSVRVLVALARELELTSLSLHQLELDDAAAIELARHRSAFDTLETLDVSFNELTRVGLDALAGIASKVISSRQSRAGSATERRIRAFGSERLQAAEALTDPTNWRNAWVDGELRWARYRGNDHYELYVSADLTRYACSCPSSFQPCKHVIALALVAERTTLPEQSSNGIEHRITRFVASLL